MIPDDVFAMGLKVVFLLFVENIYKPRYTVLNMVLLIIISGLGPELSTENILQSISAALHLSNFPIVGQHHQKVSSVQKNPGVHIDVNQPHIQVRSCCCFFYIDSII